MIIEQEFHNDLCIDESICLVLKQDESCITLDKQGAKQLIKVLQEFVDENEQGGGKMREQFEKLPEIAERLERGNVWFNESCNKYDGLGGAVANGALYAYQEQQKKIDAIVSIVREADLSNGDSSVAIVHDEIMELLK